MVIIFTERSTTVTTMKCTTILGACVGLQQLILTACLFNNIKHDYKEEVEINVTSIPNYGNECSDGDEYTSHIPVPEHLLIAIPLDNATFSVQVWLDNAVQHPMRIPTFEISRDEHLIELHHKQEQTSHYYNTYHSTTFLISRQCSRGHTWIYRITGSFRCNDTQYLLQSVAMETGTTGPLHGLIRPSVLHEENTDRLDDTWQGIQDTVQRETRLLLSGHNTPVTTPTHPYQVELLIIVDYSLYTSFYNETDATLSKARRTELAQQDLQTYIEVVAHSVNVVYKSLLKYSLSIQIVPVAILISTDTRTSPWTERPADFSEVGSSASADTLNGTVLVNDLVAFVGRLTTLPKPDHTLLLTRHILDSNGNNITDAEGFALLGKICRANSISVVRDIFDFSIVQVIAHEIGHSLGAEHDGDGNNCSPDLGNIMAPSVHNLEAHEWHFSECTSLYFKRQIGKLLSSGTNCLSVTNFAQIPPKLTAHSQQWYGQLYGADQQCVFSEGAGSYLYRPEYNETASDYRRICLRMVCKDPVTDNSATLKDAGDGTVCGHNKWCMAGECVTASINIDVADDCPQGDRPGVIKYGRNCTELVRILPQECEIYGIRTTCCHACAHVAQFNPATVNVHAIPSVDTQCRTVFGAVSRFCQEVDVYQNNFESICENMYCALNRTSCRGVRPADGTPCGHRKWCQNGTCLTSAHTSNDPEYCLFGDRAHGCDTIITGQDTASLCYSGNNANVCCKTCAPYRHDSAPADCLFGDKTNKCASHITSPYVARYCYDGNNKNVCCDTCSRYGNSSAHGCEYGDRVDNCAWESCDTYDDKSRTFVCCKTCQANCPNGDHSGVYKYGRTCRDLVRTRPQDCQEPSTRRACCESCRNLPQFNPTVFNIDSIPSVTAQCGGVFGGSTRFCEEPYKGNFESVCVNMYCKVNATSCTAIKPADGTPCGRRKWCVNGHCVNSVDTPNLPADCLFGDKLATCPSVISRDKARLCYSGNNAKTCCSTCMQYSNNVMSGCEYGDRLTGCNRSQCGSYDYNSKNSLCCSTCQGT